MTTTFNPFTSTIRNGSPPRKRRINVAFSTLDGVQLSLPGIQQVGGTIIPNVVIHITPNGAKVQPTPVEGWALAGQAALSLGE